jgi:stringent starvation protein B
MQTELHEDKKTVLEQYLETGMTLIVLDARVPGVDVPDHLRQDFQLRLNLSYKFDHPMTLSQWGVVATLTFGGVPYTCRIPWIAVFAMVSHATGHPQVFPNDIPSELLASQEQATEKTASTEAPAAPTPKKTTARKPRKKKTSSKPTLTVVKADPNDTDEPPRTPPTSPKKTPAKKKGGHLRLVK